MENDKKLISNFNGIWFRSTYKSLCVPLEDVEFDESSLTSTDDSVVVVTAAGDFVTGLAETIKLIPNKTATKQIEKQIFRFSILISTQKKFYIYLHLITSEALIVFKDRDKEINLIMFWSSIFMFSTDECRERD